jgi:hypothetical protein
MIGSATARPDDMVVMLDTVDRDVPEREEYS